MNNFIINPRTMRPLSPEAVLIMRCMAGLSYYEGERQWPMLSSNFGPNAKVVRALDVLEKAGLIERTKPAAVYDDWATNRSYRITDATRTLLAGELAQKKAYAEQRAAERHAENLRQEQERAERRAAEADIARKLAAFPALLAALHATLDACEQACERIDSLGGDSGDWTIDMDEARALLNRIDERGAA